jgi:hypothetical protein
MPEPGRHGRGSRGTFWVKSRQFQIFFIGERRAPGLVHSHETAPHRGEPISRNRVTELHDAPRLAFHAILTSEGHVEDELTRPSRSHPPLKELIARGDLQRCLVVCPGSLAEQWQDELYRRFNPALRILTNDELGVIASL